MKLKKIIHNYRLVNFTFFRIDNQPVIMDNTFSQLFSIQPVLVGCVEFENIIEFTITNSDYIDPYNDLVKSRYLVNKATFSLNSIDKIKYGIRNRINEFLDKNNNIIRIRRNSRTDI